MFVFQTPYYEYYDITGFSSLLYKCFVWNRSFPGKTTEEDREGEVRGQGES